MQRFLRVVIRRISHILRSAEEFGIPFDKHSGELSNFLEPHYQQERIKKMQKSSKKEMLEASLPYIDLGQLFHEN